MTDVRVKICGVTSAEDAAAAVAAGSDYIGLNFFPPASRSIRMEQAAAVLAAVPDGVERTALFVDPDDVLIGQVADNLSVGSALPERNAYTLIQLHGQEPPARVLEIKERTGLPAMKVVSVRDAGDLAAVEAYSEVADQLLIDAKAPEGSNIPGGHGVPFDWSLLAGRTWSLPWMLAGGLTPENVAEAIRLTGATQVDVASGVEASPGVKDHNKLKAFVAAAKS
ncbi:MAG: phosphoribosylanthranilate isomerase [Pseudomonadota bacterium]